MTQEFVPYELAVKLKALGFDEPCFKKYIAGCLWSSPTTPEIYKDIHPKSSDCLAPTFSQAFRWFREKHWLDNAVLKDRFVIETEEDLPNWYYGFKTYEEAELACLEKLIEIVESKSE